jgi:nucleoside-diphosphate-sugar epimerase
MKIAITGASGSLGRYAVQEVLNAGHQVVAIDRVKAARLPETVPSWIIDIGDLGQVCGAFRGCDSVLHLAAIPSPIGFPPEVVFSNNTIGTFNVLEAAAILGIKKVVSISSCSALGVAWGLLPVPLEYVPIDEDHPLLPQDAYGLSKQVGEAICEAFHRRTGGDALSLRFPLIWDREAFPDSLRNMAKDEVVARHTLWSFIDIRDAATACRLALETPNLGAQAFYLTAPETFVTTPSAELAERHFPTLREIRADRSGHWSFHDCTRAERLLGFKPQYTSVDD